MLGNDALGVVVNRKLIVQWTVGAYYPYNSWFLLWMASTTHNEYIIIVVSDLIRILIELIMEGYWNIMHVVHHTPQVICKFNASFIIVSEILFIQ